jgi:hypothetical protein
VGVLETCRDLDSGEEALRAHRCGQFRARHFERNCSVMSQRTGEMDRGYPAMADIALDRVAPMERGLQTGEQVGRGDPEGSGSSIVGPARERARGHRRAAERHTSLGLLSRLLTS